MVKKLVSEVGSVVEQVGCGPVVLTKRDYGSAEPGLLAAAKRMEEIREEDRPGRVLGRPH